ncbi:hypothetical protein LTR56_022013 [Elasticomyces elasticus]|nr:hypothetical protein LTR56_022013 [Elasticomyces elasticus]KAK3635029.1 hypothetical protein LTR22_019385 [Elasticomyces elasticus]KAK4915790.1 hypothetical protein LTR49_016159 [Elasticomyces elasticus]KAK5749452.1 hypothetical protein LTS12_020501 [Elasticomyces elasticus]
MDNQTGHHCICRLRKEPGQFIRPDPKVYILKVDVSDAGGPVELVYADNKDVSGVAMQWLADNKIAYNSQFSYKLCDYITSETGGRVWKIVPEMGAGSSSSSSTLQQPISDSIAKSKMNTKVVEEDELWEIRLATLAEESQTLKRENAELRDKMAKIAEIVRSDQNTEDI